MGLDMENAQNEIWRTFPVIGYILKRYLKSFTGRPELTNNLKPLELSSSLNDRSPKGDRLGHLEELSDPVRKDNQDRPVSLSWRSIQEAGFE